MYALAAGWVWRETGFLAVLGAVDIAGAGPVHMLGGVCSFAAATFLGPRIGRFDNGHHHPPMGNTVIAFLGLFILWWAWLAFNTASSYGLSRGRWGFTIRAAVMTMLGSMGGGVLACVLVKIPMHIFELKSINISMSSFTDFPSSITKERHTHSKL